MNKHRNRIVIPKFLNSSPSISTGRMLKKEKPMLSVAALIQAHGKLWDRTFAGNLQGNRRSFDSPGKSGLERNEDSNKLFKIILQTRNHS